MNKVLVAPKSNRVLFPARIAERETDSIDQVKPEKGKQRLTTESGIKFQSEFDDRRAAESELHAPRYRRFAKGVAVNLTSDGPSRSLPPVGDLSVNHVAVESWHIRDQITHGHLGKEMEVKAQLLEALRRLRRDIDTSMTDSLGQAVHLPGKDTPTDFELQKDANGKTVFENGQTLDRKKKPSADGSSDSFDGPVRGAKGSGAVCNSGFNVFRDDPLPFATIIARDNVEEITAAVGPLWRFLKGSVCDNVMSAEHGYALGKRDPQASGVGNALIRIALDEVVATYDRIDRREVEYKTFQEWLAKQTHVLPLPARRLKTAMAVANDNCPRAVAA